VTVRCGRDVAIGLNPKWHALVALSATPARCFGAGSAGVDNEFSADEVEVEIAAREDLIDVSRTPRSTAGWVMPSA